MLWLDRLKDPTGRLARWAVRLQPFNYKIIHRKGKDCVVPDFLSRSVPAIEEVVPSPLFSTDTATDRWYHKMIRLIEERPRKFSRWRVESGTLYKYVESSFPDLSNCSANWKMVVPKESRRQVIHDHHDPPNAAFTTGLKCVRLFQSVSNPVPFVPPKSQNRNFPRG